ncbi:MAG: hypothetical protein MUQ10_01990, partial [Anaerolineae bacterium]|nr:hypothetical protein [Anaerolineae bacterium]
MSESNVISVNVHVLQDSEPAAFAAAELGKYLRMMQPDVRVVLCESDTYDPVQDGLHLGLYGNLNLDAPALKDPQLDDCIHIDISELNGVIAGSNPRSILLGVYRFLEEAGCRWVRPGKDGECIPQRSLADISVQLDDAPSYRYRGCCIEGAVSYENMIENIEWIPKVGFNSYFLEFMTPYTFFERWYSHFHNKYKEPEELTVQMVKEFKRGMEREIARRGL